MATKPTPAAATREQPLAPHLSGPLEKPWLLSYDALTQMLQRRMGQCLAKLSQVTA